jgi:serine/threonine protein kinase
MFAREARLLTRCSHKKLAQLLDFFQEGNRDYLVRSDEIYLIDFGADNEFIGQATGPLIGTQAYIAPEQLRGNAVPQSDIYALGALPTKRARSNAVDGARSFSGLNCLLGSFQRIGEEMYDDGFARSN